MSFEKLYKKASSNLALTDSERRDAEVLVIDADHGTRHTLRQSLISLGFSGVTDAGDHMLGLEKLQGKKITHLIFDARKSNMPVREFLVKALTMSPKIIALASSFNPTIDDVFDLLVIGAKGYLVKPFTLESLDQAMICATKGEALSDSILNAKNRNEALASLVLTSLDKFATIASQSLRFETAKAEVPRRLMAFRRAVDVAKTFAAGGHDELLTAMIDFCCNRAEGPASRLGRVRKRIENKKGSTAKKTSKEAEEQEDSEDGEE